MNYGLFAPKTIHSREQKFQVWNLRSLELSLPPMNVARSDSSTNMYRLTCMGSSPKILGGPGLWASSCHHKHYAGDKKWETFKNLGAQPQAGPQAPA